MLLCACLLLAACAAHEKPRTQPQGMWLLPPQARDSDQFCAPALTEQPLPAPCRSVGEIRAYVRLMKAD